MFSEALKSLSCSLPQSEHVHGSIFRTFYEQGDTQELAFSQSLLDEMKDWILKDFVPMYTLAGYKNSINDKIVEISWMHIEKEAK